METTKLQQFFSRHWNATIKKCEISLGPDDLRQIHDLKSWDEVQKQVLDPSYDGIIESEIPHEITLVIPALAHLNNFTSFFESNLGPKLNAAFLWGTVGLLLQLTSKDTNALNKIPRMLKSVCYKTEIFNGYCLAAQEIVNQMKEACFDIQIRLVEFFTDVITFMRGEGETLEYGRRHGKQDSWVLLERRYITVNHEILEKLTQAEKLAQIKSFVRAQTQSSSTADQNASEQKVHCVALPPTKTSRFFDRVDLFAKIDHAFGRSEGRSSFRSIALFGPSGVGKSSIVARYVEKQVEKNRYDAAFWVHGEKTSSLRQSFTDIATRLKLPGAQPQNHDENLALVQSWFQSTECRWLVIYDNVESSDLLMPYWPEASHGRAIITTRNHSLAFEPASSGLEVTSWDSSTGSEFFLYLLKRNISTDLEAEGLSAVELSEKLSGHALSISQMAGLIHRRSWSIAELMSIYSGNTQSVHNSKLQPLWDFSFRSLEMDSFSLLGVASFLMPDNISQSLFDVDSGMDPPQDLVFCSKFSFSGAVGTLLNLALIKRNRDTPAFSIHRMIQTLFKFSLGVEQRQKFFDEAVALVYYAFPKQDETKAQLYEQWVLCNDCLQHVLHLKDCFKEERKTANNFKASWKFCELLKECQRYVYEANALQDLEDLCEVNLIAVSTLDNEDKTTDLVASILSHQANMYESIGNAEKAIELNKRGYKMRLQEIPLKQGLLAGFESNLGYNYNTANQHKTALEWFHKARDRWTNWTASQGKKPDWPIHMKKNTARCLVYLNDLSGARDLVNASITEFRDAKHLDWAMIAYAYFVLGILERREGNSISAEAKFTEAQNFWLKGNQTRLHPFNGGCMYKIGVCCLDQGKAEAAVKHLRDSIEVTKFHKNNMPVEHARNLFKLSEALFQENTDPEGENEDLRVEAEVYLKRKQPNATSFDTEEAYDNLIPIFWR